MRIVGKSIRTLDRRLPGIGAGTPVLPSLVDAQNHHAALEQAGLPLPLRAGDAVLPSVVGPRTRFNAQGDEEIHRDQPKEQVWRLVWARWLEWHGRQEVEQRGVRPRAYWQYPRTPIDAPAVQLRVAQASNANLVVVTEAFRFGVDDPDRLLHAVNVLLELFGECDLLSAELEPLLGPPSRQLNWEVLPRGRRPWESVRRDLDDVVGRLPGEEKEVAEYRLRLMHSFGPDFQAYGRGGFRGYVVFGFEERGRYVLESLYAGNATYVFGVDWERLSGLTKAEIIRGQLAEQRLVHVPGWERRLRNALS